MTGAGTRAVLALARGSLRAHKARLVLSVLAVLLGVAAIAVCYLFSFVNPAHERRIAELAQERHVAGRVGRRGRRGVRAALQR